MVLQVTKRIANIANNKYRVKKQSECFLISETFWLFLFLQARVFSVADEDKLCYSENK